MTLIEVRQDRARIAREAQKLLPEKGKAMDAETRTKFDAMMADVDRLGNEIETMEREERSAKMLASLAEPEGKPGAAPAGKETREGKKAEGYRSYLAATNSQEEMRALQMDLDVYGGYTVVPEKFLAELIVAIKAQTSIRGLCTVINVPDAASVGAPTLDTDVSDPTWTQELLVGSEDTSVAFGKRELRPYPLAKYIKVSKKLVRASALNIDALIRDRLGYKVAVTEENAFLNGNGVDQPLGVFTANANGIPITTYDVSTGNTTTEIKADGLIEAKYALRSAYWQRAKWIFHQNALKQIRKLRGNDGDFLWKAGLSSDRGDTILDVPIVTSEYAPRTFTSGSYVGIIGDFSYYWIADALNTTIQVLTELYAATNQNGYIIRRETDGMPVLAEAFIRVTLA